MLFVWHRILCCTAMLFAVMATAPLYAALGDLKSSVEINSNTPNGPMLTDYDFLGSSVAAIGDLDGDGITDLAMGAPGYVTYGGTGVLHLSFLNNDGSVKSTVQIDGTTLNGPTLIDGDLYGSSVASLGDLDGDGITDLAVGAPGSDVAGTDRGTLFIHLMNSDGSIKSTTEINSTTLNGPLLLDYDHYGTSVAALGDFNDDGVVDLAVGATEDDAGGGNRGALHIHFLNSDGSVKSTVEINDTTPNGPALADGDLYATAVTSLGDFDGDGIIDLAVSAINDDKAGPNWGAVYLHMMASDGSVKWTWVVDGSMNNGPLLEDDDRYGYSIANLGDIDGNGYVDLAVGAIEDDNEPMPVGENRGTVHIHFMEVDGAMNLTLEANSLTTNGPLLNNGDGYGRSITSLGDFDGDGVTDIAVGALYDNNMGGTQRGTVHIHLLFPQHLLTLYPNQWKQISLPCDPGASSIETIFADDMPGLANGYGVNWALWLYDSISNRYVAPDLSDPVEVGRGYWIIQISNSSMVVDMPQPCTAPSVEVSTQCTHVDGCFPIPLATTSGSITWSMPGFPFPLKSVVIDQLRVSTDSGVCADSDGCTLDEAEAATVVHNVIWHYNQMSYNTLSGQSLINPWSGFWLPTLNNANGLNPKLLVPLPE